MVSELIGNISWLLLVALIWGVTNAFMKCGVQGLEKVHCSSFCSQVLAELWHLLKNWRYMVPFLINQAGSVLFYIAVSKNEISLAVPLVNSLTLVVTLVTGRFLGETFSKGLLAGVFMVLLGVSVCIYDKATTQSNIQMQGQS